jgi:hypothetical protein
MFQSIFAPPNIINAHKYSAIPEQVAKRVEAETLAQAYFEGLTREPVIINSSKLKTGSFYESLKDILNENGISCEEHQILTRVFSRDRLDQMLSTGTDRDDNMNLAYHRRGEDFEWLAMLEFGLSLHETSRTTYIDYLTKQGMAFFDPQTTLADSKCLALYDRKGLIHCQPSNPQVNIRGNGHHLFVCPPKHALIGIVV